jgi:hypothetical protein
MAKPQLLIFVLALVMGLAIGSGEATAQDNNIRPEASQTRAPGTSLWLGVYGKFRLSEKLFWDGQFHYRRNGYDGTPYIGRMGQIYNRHALNYLVTPRFQVSLGPVLRLNFTPEPGNDEFENIVLEPRIWHEYLWAIPFGRIMIYHRIRIEHRWSRSNRVDADWIYRDRWRYKLYMAIPINKRKLEPGAFFFTPDVEIIMQSGKYIVDNPMEDLRINPSIGYIASPRVKYTVGMMYTTGQTSEMGYIYNSRWVMRLNVYLSLDFRKFKERVPETKFFD